MAPRGRDGLEVSIEPSKQKEGDVRESPRAPCWFASFSCASLSSPALGIAERRELSRRCEERQREKREREAKKKRDFVARSPPPLSLSPAAASLARPYRDEQSALFFISTSSSTFSLFFNLPLFFDFRIEIGFETNSTSELYCS